MARFQASGGSTDETSSVPAARPKPVLQPTLSSGPPVQTKKPVLESLSGGAINVAPKPNFLKNTVSAKSDTEPPELNKAKALASRFANTQDDTNANSKPLQHKQPLALKSFSQLPETKGPAQKPPLSKPPLSSTMSDAKPAFPKPSPAITSKPSWVKEDSGGGPAVPTPPTVPPLQQKPSSSVLKLRQQNEDITGANKDISQSNFKSAQNMFNKEKDKTEQPENDATADGVNKAPLSAKNSSVPPKPPANKKPSLYRPSKPSPAAQTSSINDDTTSGPKRKPLPNSLALGPAPSKPNRPPKVNLENFKRGAEASDDGLATIATNKQQCGCYSQQGSYTWHPQAMNTPAISGIIYIICFPFDTRCHRVQQEDFYDDVDEFSSAPPPLPPSAAHPSQRGKLVGPLEVIQQGKARVDCKGGKTDLALKQGEPLDIIRVQGNPEGKWLGRTQDGSIGYVKTTSVEIDFDTLKKRKATQQTYDPEVYDDIDVAPSDNSGKKGVVLPPLPGGEGGEIYDDVLDPNLDVSNIPDIKSSLMKNGSFLRIFDRSRHQPAATDEEIYDDVDSQNVPPPPPLSSLLTLKKKNDEDSKKQKKFEKEEKEFRKKFKYEGEIQVLYQVDIIPTLNNKKWSGKELPVKAGEKLDVIVKAADNKLICRNEEGKYYLKPIAEEERKVEEAEKKAREEQERIYKQLSEANSDTILK
ncbi:FYN-binding protein [Collichthys lucidus]|uniref:FYN-binding protein n=1 Tax=Collichthys lucidus TaxID=240159 RepID=A0A4U5VCG4_COLLU|nr:FYN-binding protein [Collichthys lucidus]